MWTTRILVTAGFLAVLGGGLVGAGWCAAPSTAVGGPHLFVTDAEVEQTKRNIASYPWAAEAWRRLQANAETALRIPSAPADPSADYASDGRVNGSCPRAAGGWFCALYFPGLTDGQNAYALALAWRIGGSGAYAQRAKEILFDWVRKYTRPATRIGHMVAEPVGPMIKLFITADLLRSALTAAEFGEVQRWAAQWVAVGKRTADASRDDPWAADVTYNGMATNAAAYGNSPMGQRAMAVWAAGIAGGSTLSDTLAWNWSHRTPEGHEYGWLDVIEHVIIPGTGGETVEGRYRQSVGYGLFAWSELILIADLAHHAGYERDLFQASSPSSKSLLSVTGFYGPLLTGERAYPYSTAESFLNRDYEQIKAHFRAIFEIPRRVVPASSSFSPALDRIVTTGGDGQRAANEDQHFTGLTALAGAAAAASAVSPSEAPPPSTAPGPTATAREPAAAPAATVTHLSSVSFGTYATSDDEAIEVRDVPDRMLLFVFAGKLGSDAVSSVTYAGRELTRLAARGEGSVRLELWHLPDPPAGTGRLAWSKSGVPENTTWGASVFSGVDLEAPFAGIAAAGARQDASSHAKAVSLASRPGGLVAGAAVFNGSRAATGPDGGDQQTSRWSRSQSTTQGAAATAAGAGSVTLGWTPAGSALWDWAVLAVALNPRD